LNISAPFWVGGDWWKPNRIVGRSAFPNSRTAFQATDSLSLDDIRQQLESASTAFTGVFHKFAVQINPVYSTSTVTMPSLLATLAGLSARTAAVQGTSSVVQTTAAVNTQTSTVRSSSSALGLNLTASASQLDSSALGLDVTSTPAPSTLTSSASLGLNLTSAASTITSTAKMDTAMTAYGSNTLNFTGGASQSTSTGTLSGTYTGVNTAANATSLKVVVTSTAVVNTILPTNVQFQVQDQSGNVLFTFNGNVKAGDHIYLGNNIGLSISFSAGQLIQTASASTTVSHGPFNVDPNAAFNASPSQRPQFDNNAQVTAGSFTINGTSITVNANDTINTVIARINASGAGVTASLANDKITLTTNSASQSNIVLANDTSGFLNAVKLAGATTVQGHIADNQKVLSQTTQFGSVVSGSFTVNGVSISVNQNTDTLTSIINRINSSNAGVTASYNSSQDKIVLTTNSNSEDLITVANDTSGFLSAAHLATGNTVRGHIPEDQQVLSKLSQFASVTAGSFTINGATISLNPATDTVETLVTAINNANAGVTASFSSTLNKVVITATSNGKNPITVANDTSGFLAAAGLSSGNTILGKLADDQEILSKTSEFSSVTSGTFTVNGTSITVDAAHDSLESVITKINNAGAGVTASYNSATDKVVFTPNTAGATLSLDNDTTGFLAGVKVATGTVGTHANPDAAFNATGLNGPLFDPGMTVQAGSFQVNGVTITVSASDTINTVLAKITSSAAGVTATYNAASQTVKLVTNQPSATAITVSSDTSGFLAAVKLNGTAQSTPGAVTASAFDSTLNRMTEYSVVHTGTISVNGQAIAIDPSTTTINGLVSALNAIPDVTAALDQTSGKLTI
jgi:hypothetical protein